jgi:hypothetical protein
VVEASLALLVSSNDMRFTSGTDTWIGGGGWAATRTGGEAATRPLDLRSATVRLQRVRAFMRVTRRAKGSACCPGAGAGGSASLTPPARRCEPVALLSDAGGPSPLTGDRQKPGCYQSRLVYGVACQLDGRLGTRNTVPSRARRASENLDAVALCRI